MALSSRIVGAMGKWPGSREPNKTAFGIFKHTKLPLFEYTGAEKSGAMAKGFADAMSFFQAGPGIQTSLLIDNYDWSTCKKMVDIGGSHGVVTAEVTKKFPDIECVVQDLPRFTAAVTERRDRATFQENDFFTKQPVEGADVYLFRMIFHNWSDKDCVQILQSLIPALEKGSKVLINDHVVSPPGVLPPYEDRAICAFDLVMKQLFNAKERSIDG